MAKRVGELGVKELTIAGMCAEGQGHEFLSREAMEQAAKYIGEYEDETGLTLTVDSCFSPLRACLGGEDPKRNGNRGITCGCEAGRSFCAVRADGSFSPCLRLSAAEKAKTLAEYWEQSTALEALREEKGTAACEGCSYLRRCRPCPLAFADAVCPMKKGATI